MKTTYSKSSNVGQKAETHLGNWCITTMKRMNGSIRCTAILCENLENGMLRYSSDSPSHNLASSRGRATAAEIKRVHEAGLTCFRDIMPSAFAEADAPATPSAPLVFSIPHSPWGKVDGTCAFGDLGLLHHSTPGHGGIYVPDEMLAAMPAPYRKANGGSNWFEEDCEWALVALSFPSGLSAETMETATRTVINYHPREYTQVTGEELTADQSYLLRSEAFKQATRDKYVVIAATASSFDNRENVPAGLVGCFAVRGGRAANGHPASTDVKYLLVPAEEYATRTSNGFVIEKEYKEWPVRVPSAA